VSLIWQTGNRSPGKLWFLLVMIGGAFLIEISFRVITGRKAYFSKSRQKGSFKS